MPAGEPLPPQLENWAARYGAVVDAGVALSEARERILGHTPTPPEPLPGRQPLCPPPEPELLSPELPPPELSRHAADGSMAR